MSAFQSREQRCSVVSHAAAVIGNRKVAASATWKNISGCDDERLGIATPAYAF